MKIRRGVTSPIFPLSMKPETRAFLEAYYKAGIGEIVEAECDSIEEARKLIGRIRTGHLAKALYRKEAIISQTGNIVRLVRAREREE